MNYDFSFNKKTLSLLLAGCAFVCIMLFIAGMLIGANWKSEPAVAANTTAPAAVGQQPATPPAPDQATAPQAAAPKETALRAEPVTQRPPDPSEVIIPSPAPTPVRQAHRNITFGSGRESAPPPIPEGDDVKIIQEAEQTAPPEESGAKPSFSIQVGVFVKEGDANQLVRQLQSKGYAPFVLTANDDGSKVLYAVRVGAYANFDEAARAASDFTKQEKIQTMVRPLGSL